MATVSDAVAYDSNLHDVIKTSFPIIYHMMANVSLKGTLNALKAIDVFKSYRLCKKMEVHKTGKDNYKTWASYGGATKKYFRSIPGASDKRLEPAVDTISHKVFQGHYVVFPEWPTEEKRTQSTKMILNEKDSYYYTFGGQKFYIAWKATGDLVVTDIRNAHDSYYAEFNGEMSLKLLYFDFVGMQQIEDLFLTSPEKAK
eukprot:346684_1